MPDERKPADFDWVTARHECSMAVMFGRLRALAERDVKLRQQQIAGSGTVFEFDHRERGNSFAVLRTTGGDIVERLFTMQNGQVDVTGAGPTLTFGVSMTFDGHCKFKQGDHELDPWQVLWLSLEPFLFG